MKIISGFTDRLAKNDIVVVDDIHDMSIYGEPYLSHNFLYSICHKGYTKGLYDMQAISFAQHDVCVLYPHHAVQPNENSKDFRVTWVVISEEFFKTISSQQFFNNRFRYESSPCFHLTDSQYADIMSIINAMKTLDRSEHRLRKMLMCNILDVLMEMTDDFRDQNEPESKTTTPRISHRLYEAIAENFRKHHDVDFYAALFCITPKHFSTLIKKETGLPASYWIRQYVTIQAKQTLRKDFHSSIQEISDRLGFTAQTDFCRYFKRETGITPSEYRRRLAGKR